MKPIYKNKRLSICILLLSILCILTSKLYTSKANEFDPNSYVTFGVYSSSNNGIVESTSIKFSEHVLYGLSLSIYNRYVSEYGSNTNYPSDFTVIRNRLINIFGQDFWNNVSTYRFMVNAYEYDNGGNHYILLLFNRGVVNSGVIFDRNVNMSDEVTFQILPQGYTSSYYFATKQGGTGYNFYNILGYLNKSGLGIADTNRLSSTKSVVTISDLTSAMVSSSVRSFQVLLSITLPAVNFSNVVSYCYVNAYTNDETFSGIAYTDFQRHCVPIMTDFPVLTYNEDGNASTNFLYYNYPYTYLYYNRMPSYTSIKISETLSPVLLSGYEYIPTVTTTPTMTPTPLPTWTPYPTPTPFPPVNEIEGISQMMTLFTRKYEFNINGNVIGIRPLYLFVFTFLVGAIFKAIQGGDRN